MGQDGCVQALQRLPGIDAELTGEQVAGPPVGGERLGLPAAAVQRQHELAVQPLPQRMLSGQLFQLGGERVVPAKRQVSVDPGLQRGEPQLLQAGCLGPGERIVGQVGQHPLRHSSSAWRSVPAASAYRPASSAARPAVNPSWNRAASRCSRSTRSR